MVDKAFNGQVMEVFKGSDLKENIKEMFTHMRMQIENLAFANSQLIKPCF